MREKRMVGEKGRERSHREERDWRLKRVREKVILDCVQGARGEGEVGGGVRRRK